MIESPFKVVELTNGDTMTSFSPKFVIIRNAERAVLPRAESAKAEIPIAVIV